MEGVGNEGGVEESLQSMYLISDLYLRMYKELIKEHEIQIKNLAENLSRYFTKVVN